MLVVSSENSGYDLDSLASRNWCRDLNSMSQPHSLSLYCISVSRPRFDVATSFLLRRHSIVLSLQAVCDSKLVVFLFPCYDMEFRSRPSIFFNHCSSCRDLKNMSRPCFLPIQSQPHFSVITFPFNFSISGLDLTILLYFGIYVATSI